MKIAASIFLLALTLCDSAVPRESFSSRMIREAKENVKAGPPDGPPDDACGDLITKMTADTYTACDDLGFQLSTSDFSYSDKSANDFCNNNCAKLMEDTTSQMVTQCNLPSGDEDIVKQLAPMWDAACKTSNGKHCIDLWRTMMSSDYMACVSQHSDNWTCPPSCNTILQSLTHSLGCCYMSIANVNKENDPPLYFDQSLWTACKLEEPPKACQ